MAGGLPKQTHEDGARSSATAVFQAGEAYSLSGDAVDAHFIMPILDRRLTEPYIELLYF